MAYKLNIEFGNEMDLQNVTHAYNRIIALIAKQIGLVNIKSAELLDTEYKTLLDYRHGFALPKAIEEYQEKYKDKTEEELLELLRRTKIVQEEEKSAKH